MQTTNSRHSGILFLALAIVLALAPIAAAEMRMGTENGRLNLPGVASDGNDGLEIEGQIKAGSAVIRGAASFEVAEIGTPGELGFGVGAYLGTLPSGFTALAGASDIRSPNYGNYQYADGSIMVWIPKFYYKIHDGTVLPKDTAEIRGSSYFASTAAANSAGYALHRAFIDGGLEQAGFFIDKYKCSKNALGTGFVASSIANGNPISAHADHNPIADLTAVSANNYASTINAAHARDGVDGAVNADSIFFVVSRFQRAALAMLSLAHAQASAAATPWNAWYNSTSNFPKGCNNNALADANDTAVTFTTDGYSNSAKTGSGIPFAKTTHNGQASGVTDLNGLMHEVSIGMTAVATSPAIEGITSSATPVFTLTGHGLSAGSYVQIDAITQADWVNFIDKIWSVATVPTADTFTLTSAPDTTGYAAYDAGADPGTFTIGTFYAAKEATRMRSFTSGSASVTDHWGATGVAAMMDTFVPVFATTYPNNGFAQRFGNSGQVLSGATSGAGWVAAGLGFPALTGIGTSGTTPFGQDHYYQYIRNDLCLRSGAHWNSGSTAGVWAAHWYGSRAYSDNAVGFRAACYPD
jgi:hypothetical protein